MQIVIDVSEKIYEQLQEDRGLAIAFLIANGTPLPKGHGRLIDADALYEAHKRYWRGEEIIDLRNAPTIIEADKAESEV